MFVRKSLFTLYSPAVRISLIVSAIAIGLSIPWPAYAQKPDGLYGRFDGDFTLSAGAGAGVLLGSKQTLSFVGDLRARYLDSAGLVVGPELSEDNTFRLSLAADIRPVFLWRFFTYRSFYSQFFDLWLGFAGHRTWQRDRQSRLRVGSGPLAWCGHGHSDLGERYSRTVDSLWLSLQLCTRSFCP